MATTQQMPPQAATQATEKPRLPLHAADKLRPAVTAASPSSEQALVPAPQTPEQAPVEETNLDLSAPMALLPVELDVAIPLRDFRVRNLLALEPGRIIESQWGHGEDVPLASGNVQLAWSEFEVIDTQLAVRVTRLP